MSLPINNLEYAESRRKVWRNHAISWIGLIGFAIVMYGVIAIISSMFWIAAFAIPFVWFIIPQYRYCMKRSRAFARGEWPDDS